MNILKRGDVAPGFAGIDQDGNMVTLDQYQGYVTILFFYPHDCFSGCTNGNCYLRNNFKQWSDKGFKIIGICVNNYESVKNYISKHSLPITLIEDKNKLITEKYRIRDLGEEKESTPHLTFVISQMGYIGQIIITDEKVEHQKQMEFHLNYRSVN